MTREEVGTALANQQTIVWDDPNRVEGNCYKVQRLWKLTDDTAEILYGDDEGNHDTWSEAVVLLTELSIEE
jgi:hypothetical protein